MKDVKEVIWFLFSIQSLPLVISRNHNHEDFLETDVVIVGGGASGIAAAEAFYEANVDFLLLEADQKIGGRIQNQQFGDYVVENGANWIHGPYTDDDPPIHNPIWDFKNRYDMNGSFSDWEDLTIRTRNGKVVENTKLSSWRQTIDFAKSFCFDEGEALWKQAKKENLKSPESIDISLGVCLNQNGYDRTSDTNLDRLLGNFLKYFEFDADVTIPASNMSLMLWASEHLEAVEYNSDAFLVTDQRGYNIFLNKISNPYKRFIKLNHIVTLITYDNYGVTVEAKIKDTLNSKAGTATSYSNILRIRAKYVICTVPLGVLQKGTIEFDPPLTNKKIESIQEMKMGNYAKVYLRFPYNFWGQKEVLINLGEPIGLASFGLNLDNPKIFPGSNIITFHSVGDNAIKVETQDVEATKSELMRELRKFYTDTIPEPIDIHVTNWTSNPFSYGSYSALPIGFTSTMWKELRTNVGNLYFSGEHTNTHYSATVHGAFEAGKVTANEVLKELRKLDSWNTNTASPSYQNLWFACVMFIIIQYHCVWCLY